MTHLTVYPDTDPATVLLDTRDGAEIAASLSGIGVVFERWDAPHALGEDADQTAVLAAYEADVKRLMDEGGYKSVDVVRVKPDNPNRAEMRQKFLAEHTHDDDEVRFFVEGAGAFYLRKDGRVYRVVCERNDLISVPAGTTHWFDTGAAPHFCAIRIFTSPEGWVGHFTGDDIATRFPKFESEPQ
ncbi:Acireductone dioxygenase ARD [Parvibaculum lavamentivorans DS-1]|uniref:Acireductone dioxygenase n=1 Tax=Parvibaculum lavamentivorans (strain DS-1 / DSM 13023 / NCIMB 13966) TaxID=402881 RepID=MTND_PARL1|nr:acireductone dioxygenase [Parvibaculum lavamentivorans]A7HU87.1 RecName: Full=Acireductone dioxygenase; AltName: Full=1,2-dihydroxy-3-keto-5-methylthiopentene dioxygenase; Short=DHK-MTPene dioxygenase; AltName: Full=Acireductone dioxygenase (Fe(2+)-requiring); Short=ARD'; Short=Fe-ARD; AltName: Full=Acireductone dioxygenase (Ni(2+)-requiring); Short=ARD; Short=Ni-ARD [Parvibaculum lavamentivorans DS-1]ABS63470.1 Acireductone dioxygenase ARD [Parvibaculum lavamentivorans DS-1]